MKTMKNYRSNFEANVENNEQQQEAQSKGKKFTEYAKAIAKSKITWAVAGTGTAVGVGLMAKKAWKKWAAKQAKKEEAATDPNFEEVK